MGCDISVGQGTEFIRPDIVESQSQPLFLTHPLYCFRPHPSEAEEVDKLSNTKETEVVAETNLSSKS